MIDKQETSQPTETGVTLDPKTTDSPKGSPEKSKTSLASPSLPTVNFQEPVEQSDEIDEAAETSTNAHSRQEVTTAQEEQTSNTNLGDKDREMSINEEQEAIIPPTTKKESISSFKKFSLDLPLNSIQTELENSRKASKEIELCNYEFFSRKIFFGCLQICFSPPK